MTMESSDLLPALRGLPGGETRQRMSFREIVTGLVSTDRTMYAAEFASAVSFGMWGVFDNQHVSDNGLADTLADLDDGLSETEVNDGVQKMIFLAHARAFPEESRTPWEHHQDALNAPETYDNSFLSPLKGAVAEIQTKEEFNQRGWNVDLASDLKQPGWDLYGTDPSGNHTKIQVKTGTSYDPNDIQDHMDKYPTGDVDHADHYAMSTEIYGEYIESGRDSGGRALTDIGSGSELEEDINAGLELTPYSEIDGTTDGLNTLSANKEIDIPDDVIDILPYAGAIIAGARLVYSVLKTEKEFKAADRTTKNQMQVVQTLTLMSRMGVTTVLSMVGGSGGAAGGSAVPGIGNVAGGIGGAVIGAVIGMYLNKHLQPHMLDLALDITGLTRDDLFYYKNKPRIDEIALSFHTRARELAVASVP